MHAYAKGPDLDRLIALAHGEPAGGKPSDDILLAYCWLPVRRAKCTNSADRQSVALIGSRGSRFARELRGLTLPGSPLPEGRAVVLKRRRKARDEVLGREGKPSQSPSRKGRRQTLNRCLVQPAPGVDARMRTNRLHPLAERQAPSSLQETGLFSPVPGCALLTFETI